MEPTLDLDSLQRAVDALRVQESVQQERQQLETMKAAVDGNIEQFKQRVKLNVGGSKFETTLSTLTRHPDSMLAVMFSGRHEVPRDDDGYVFIDRDGTHFRIILNFLRTGALDVPTSQKAASELTRELQYYQLDTSSTTASTPGSFELVETVSTEGVFSPANPGAEHTRRVQAMLQANPSLKVVNSFATAMGRYLYVYTALAA
mgnify:CR=1 FL=1